MRELLPDGEYVTLERIKEITPDGVKAIAKGTRVRVVGEKDGKLIISDSKVTLLALAGELTNDKEKADSFFSDALANKPAAPVVMEPSEPKEEAKKPDYSAYIAQLDARINSYKDQIKELKYHKTGKISGNGAIIARIQIELDKLENERRRYE